jgi:hypothetical protein
MLQFIDLFSSVGEKQIVSAKIISIFKILVALTKVSPFPLVSEHQSLPQSVK